MELVFAMVGGASAVLAAFAVHRWRGDDARRTRRVLRKARVIPISELVDGQLACIVGQVVRGETLTTSLMQNLPCVAFDTITHVVEHDQDFTAPVVSKATRHMVPFFVVDKTGRARIDAPQAALCNKPSSSKRTWVERIVEEGATVRLVGSVLLDPTERDTREHGFRDGAWKVTITGTVKFPLLIDVVD